MAAGELRYTMGSNDEVGRWTALAAVGVMAGLWILLLGLIIAWDGSLLMALMPLPGLAVGVRRGRTRTTVTPNELTIRGFWRTTTLPVDSVKEIVAPGRFGNHVLAQPREGYPVQLLYAQPGDVEDIAALTGLPVRVSQSPE